MDQVFQSLVAAGPLALVLGIAVKVLWSANVEERARHAAEEVAIRRESLAALKEESDRHTAEEDDLRREYVDTLKKLTGALRGESHA